MIAEVRAEHHRLQAVELAVAVERPAQGGRLQ